MLLSIRTHRHANKFNRRVKQNSVGTNVFHDCLTITNEDGTVMLALNYFPKFFPNG